MHIQSLTFGSLDKFRNYEYSILNIVGLYAYKVGLYMHYESWMKIICICFNFIQVLY